MPSNAFEAAAGNLSNARVLITGANSGIGRALTLGFAGAGARVALHYRSDSAAAQDLVASLAGAGKQAYALHADLLEPGAGADLVRRGAEALGGLDVLVNNAGGPLLLQTVAEMDDEHVDRVFRLNARSVVDTCRAAVPLISTAGGGAIINITSLSARTGSSPGASIYGAAKAFVTAFTKTLAREVAMLGIRVNALSPGFIETPLHALTPEDLRASWARQIPLGRAGTPEDCVGPALFLATPTLSGFVTGQVLEVNGGQAMPG